LAPDFQNAQLLVRLGVALAIGLLVGLEEADRRYESAEEQRAAEIRTLGGVGLLGGLTLELGTLSVPLLVAVWTVLITALHYRRESPSSASPLNLVVTILTFFLGTVAGVGQLRLAACSALALMLALRMLAKINRIVGDPKT
jgi:hypothetical protein